MKRLETRIRERLATEFPGSQPVLDHVNAKQFFGLDIIPFAIELAKVSMMIGRKLAIDELHIADERDLPLDNLDLNFQAVDALICSIGDAEILGTDRTEPFIVRTPWPKSDVIIGNPPFLGAKWLKPNRGTDYVNTLRKLYAEVPGMADYCVYWFRRAADHLPECTKEDPLAGRAGLVGTQNIRNNQSRVGGLDHVVETGTIVEAVDNQPWSGEANVNVSIANWIKTREAKLLPSQRRLWVQITKSATKTKRVRGGINASKQYDLISRLCGSISASLSDATDVTTARTLTCNTDPHRSYQGVTPGHDGFVLSAAERESLLDRDPSSRTVVFPYLTGDDLVSEPSGSGRFIIDFESRSIVDAQRFHAAFKLVREKVLPDVQAKADDEHASENARKSYLGHWWQLWRSRQELVSGMKRLQDRYVACSRVTKRPIFVFLSTVARPSDKVQAFLFDDDFSFGLLQSSAHWQWFQTKSSKLTERLSYSTESVFETFPWPQSPTAKQIEAVASAAVEVRRVRADALKLTTGGLRAVYRTLELPGKHPLKDAHVALDAAVLTAYGFDAKKDLLAQLLELNLTVAALEKQEKKVTAPGIPPTYPNPTKLVTDDCIKP